MGDKIHSFCFGILRFGKSLYETSAPWNIKIKWISFNYSLLVPNYLSVCLWTDVCSLLRCTWGRATKIGNLTSEDWSLISYLEWNCFKKRSLCRQEAKQLKQTALLMHMLGHVRTCYAFITQERRKITAKEKWERGSKGAQRDLWFMVGSLTLKIIALLG